MKDQIYLDNGATTPVRPEVLDAMLPYLSDQTFGNPSSAHSFGREARAGVDNARRTIAGALGVQPAHVVFTSGGTESDNLAVLGGALAARATGAPFSVAVGATEHKAVIAAAQQVAAMGGRAVFLPVDEAGVIDLDALDDALEQGVAVVSVMWVNNETGVIQDVGAIGERCRSTGAVFHTDAVQAIGKLPVTVPESCTMLTLSGHKFGAPKGIGALIVRDGDAIQALLHGGGQQSGLRPGTENIAGIVGLGTAVRLAVAEQPETAASLRDLRDDLESRLVEHVPDLMVTGASAERAPHISNVCIPGTDSEAMVMHLDLAGIAVSTGSACTSGSVEPSHVLKAMAIPEDLAVTALRFSFYKQNTRSDVDRVVSVLPEITKKVRRLAGVLGR
ncbi:MAG: cysteine desulfurase family protein [Gemmatimonadales bacterium]